MQRKLIILSAFFIWVVPQNPLKAQNRSDAIFFIKLYIKKIDSLAKSDTRQRSVMESIAEGPMTSVIKTITKIGHSNRVDTTVVKRTGGWSKYEIMNIHHDTLYRVRYHDNINKNFYLTFYYKENQLLYAILEYQEDGIGVTFYKREEYYDKEEKVHTDETKSKLAGEFKNRVNTNLYKEGNKYFLEFIGKK